jgi:hypothetical protein
MYRVALAELCDLLATDEAICDDKRFLSDELDDGQKTQAEQ